MTEDYLQPRNAGPLPEGYNAGPLRTLARNECCDWQGAGACARTGEPCVLSDGNRCRWMEAAILPESDNAAVQAEYQNALAGTTVKRGAVPYAERVRMALEDLLTERRRVGVTDVVRYAQLPLAAVRKHIGTQARALGLERQMRGREALFSRREENA